MLTTIKCLPSRHGALRAWTIVQVAAGSRRELTVLAPTGREAIMHARAMLEASRGLEPRHERV